MITMREKQRTTVVASEKCRSASKVRGMCRVYVQTQSTAALASFGGVLQGLRECCLRAPAALDRSSPLPIFEVPSCPAQ